MLVLMLLPAFVAAALILVQGGSTRVVWIRIRAWWLIIPAAVLQWANSGGHYPTSVADGTATRVVTASCLVLAAALCWLNWTGRPRIIKAGLGLIFAGAVVNAIPILAYGGMPYSTSAALTSGFSKQQLADGANGHMPIEPDHATALVAFSDIVPLPGLMKVVSLGDVALLVGLIVVLAAMAGRGSAASHTTSESAAAEPKPYLAKPSRMRSSIPKAERR